MWMKKITIKQQNWHTHTKEDWKNGLTMSNQAETNMFAAWYLKLFQPLWQASLNFN